MFLSGGPPPPGRPAHRVRRRRGALSTRPTRGLVGAGALRRDSKTSMGAAGWTPPECLAPSMQLGGVSGFCARIVLACKFSPALGGRSFAWQVRGLKSVTPGCSEGASPSCLHGSGANRHRPCFQRRTRFLSRGLFPPTGSAGPRSRSRLPSTDSALPGFCLCNANPGCSSRHILLLLT